MLCLAAGWRYAFARRARKRAAKNWVRALWPGDWRRGSIADPSWVLPGAGVVAGAWMLIAKQLELQSKVPGQLDNIVQGWDIQWHVNAVRFIMEEGIASPTRMGELQNPETHIDLFYPSAFHAATALFASAGDLAPVEAVNLASIVLPSLALTAGAAGLAWAMARGRGMVAQIAAGLAAIAVYASPVLVWIPDFVGMRPYIVAIGLSGIVIALFHQVPRYRALALPTLFAFLGMMQVHPSAVLVVVLAVLLYWLTYLVWRPDRSRVSDVLWLAIPALGATVAFLPQLIAGQTQAEEVNTWDASENVTSGEAWEKAFKMSTRHVGEFFPDFDPTILLWLAGFGAIAMVVWRGQVWAPVFYAWLASRPEAHEGLVMGESTDGYSWAYAIDGVPTVARHYLWPNGGLGVDSNLLADRAGQLGAGERGRPNEKSPADDAAADLGVRFIVSSGNTFWPGPKNWQVDKALWTTPGVTPVYQRGRVTIFAVNAQLTPAEIKELQRDAVANGGSTELPELTPTSEELAAAGVE